MTYIRLSITRARRGQEDRLKEIQGQIAEWVRTQPGCTASYLLAPNDNSGDIARITLYDSEEDADQSAQHPHLLSLRSELNLVTEGDHVERGFETLAEYL